MVEHAKRRTGAAQALIISEKKDDRLKRAVFSWWSMRRDEQVRRKPQL